MLMILLNWDYSVECMYTIILFYLPSRCGFPVFSMHSQCVNCGEGYVINQDTTEHFRYFQSITSTVQAYANHHLQMCTMSVVISVCGVFWVFFLQLFVASNSKKRTIMNILKN